MIPAARPRALLIKESATNELQLKAHVPSGELSASMTLRSVLWSDAKGSSGNALPTQAAVRS